jgi:O-acetylserine/cysteine efflux transporter
LSHLNSLTIASILYLAWAATLFGYGVWTSLMSRYPANKIAPFTLLVPIVGLLAGYFIFSETLQIIHFIGCASLMIGLVTNVFGPSIWAWLQTKR